MAGRSGWPGAAAVSTSTGKRLQAKRAVKAGRAAAPTVFDHGPVVFDRVVPPSGNLEVLGKQFWPGPARAGLLVTLWADTLVIPSSIIGRRVKSVRSHLPIADLAVLSRQTPVRSDPYLCRSPRTAVRRYPG